MAAVKIATFKVDVTPEVGQPLCAGWYGRAKKVDEALVCTGVVLSGDGRPAVLVAIDFCELSNDSYLAFCTRIAEAVGTDPDRVAVQCMHNHCAPWPDIEAQREVADFDDVMPVTDLAWDEMIMSRVAEAAADAANDPTPATHMQVGQAAVRDVASNRRCLGADGKVAHVRYTKTKDPAIINEPQGLIDPVLRSISFWNDDRKLAAMHYYAVHPTNQDKDFTVTPDFAGLARNRRQADEPDALHMYFTGCAGNITAGKYNDGDYAQRPILRDKIYDAMVEAEQGADRFELRSYDWHVEPVTLPARPDLSIETLRKTIADPKANAFRRNHDAIPLAYLKRLDRPTLITCLTLGDRVKVLNLPGESFIEYQLEAQLQSRGHVVLTASYGDCGPGYICLERSFAEGGYEPTDSFVAPESEHIMRQAIRRCIVGDDA